jgi:CRP-like cAMP-binding protein
MLARLFDYIQTISPISGESRHLLGSIVTTRSLPKRGYLVKENEVCKTLFFINTGYCRAFHTIDGREINTRFYFENDFVTNIRSLTQNQKSEYAIQACEPLCVVAFDKQKLLDAYQLAPEIATFGRKLLEQLVARQEAHADHFKLLNAQQRYIHMQTHQPELLQRISLTHLSSYLGVSRETVSRIRNRSRILL